MRHNLKKARNEAGMTQQQMADYLGITLRYYKKLESGEALGAIILWDLMEGLFGTSQRALREIQDKSPCQASNQQEHSANLQ